MKGAEKAVFSTAVRWLIFVATLIVIWGLFISMSGSNPIEGLLCLFQGAFGGRYELLSTLNKMVPMVLTAFAAAVPAWAGVWNIGAEGQLLLGGFVAAVVGAANSVKELPSLLGIIVILASSTAVGIIWALWPVLLKVYMEINEVVTTLLSNYIAALLTSYFVNYPFRAPGSPWAQTEYIPDKFVIHPIMSGTEFSATFFIMCAVVATIIIFERFSVLGYKTLITGKNEKFARQAGVNTKAIEVFSMIVGGGLAGFAGGLLVLGVNYRFMEGFSPGYGFTGLLIALIANNNSFMIMLVALLFAGLQTGAVNLELFTDVPAEVSGVLQAILVFFASARLLYRRKH